MNWNGRRHIDLQTQLERRRGQGSAAPPWVFALTFLNYNLSCLSSIIHNLSCLEDIFALQSKINPIFSRKTRRKPRVKTKFSFMPESQHREVTGKSNWKDTDYEMENWTEKLSLRCWIFIWKTRHKLEDKETNKRKEGWSAKLGKKDYHLKSLGPWGDSFCPWYLRAASGRRRTDADAAWWWSWGGVKCL